MLQFKMENYPSVIIPDVGVVIDVVSPLYF